MKNILRAAGRDWDWSPRLETGRRGPGSCLILNPGWIPWVCPAHVSLICWHHLVASQTMWLMEKLPEPFLPLQEWINLNHSKLYSDTQSMIIRNYQSKKLALVSFESKPVTLHLYPNSWQYHIWAGFQDFHITDIFTEQHWHLYSCKFQRTSKAIIVRYH